jgi:asparagine synthase (glutamine-hydrolysing)
MDVFLTRECGFKWHKQGRNFFKGFFYCGASRYYEQQEAIVFITGQIEAYGPADVFSKLNGHYTFIQNGDEESLVFCDKTRLFPIFYTYLQGSLIASDDIDLLKYRTSNSIIDPVSLAELKAGGFVSGKHTLIGGIYQVQGAELLTIEQNRIHSTLLHSFRKLVQHKSSYQEQLYGLGQVLRDTASRFISSLGGRQVAIPLSGGFDSRLVAAMLKTHGYDNVICYTYGKAANKEIPNARQTALKLGYKWVFIEYSANEYKGLLSSEVFRAYCRYTANNTSMPFLQEYFAVKHIKENSIAGSDAIFAPGHSGDYMAGSQLYYIFGEDTSKENITSRAISKIFHLYGLPAGLKNEIAKRISYCIEARAGAECLADYSVLEDFDFHERLAKHIINSSSVYNFFGYQHRMPLMDSGFTGYCQNMPFSFRAMKKLYIHLLQQEYFAPLGINFSTELQPSLLDINLQKAKQVIKPFLPGAIKNKFLLKNDMLLYQLACTQMLEYMKGCGIGLPAAGAAHNAIISAWYASEVENANI